MLQEDEGDDEEAIAQDPEPGQNIGKAAFIVGGSGVAIWGVSILISLLAVIIILGEALSAYSNSSSSSFSSFFGLPNTTLSEVQFLSAIAVLIFILYITASIFIAIIGSRLAMQSTSRRLTSVVISVISVADILLGAILLRAGSSSAGIGAYLITSAILAILAFGLYMTETIGTKVAGTILGLVSVVLFSVNVYAIIGLISPYAAQSSSTAFQQIWGTFSTGFFITIASMIFGLVVMTILSFFDRANSKGRTILHAIFLISPFIFGIAVVVTSLEIGFWLSNALSTIPQSVVISSPQESFAIDAVWVIVIGSILSGIGGILMVVGSGLGMGYLGNSLRFMTETHSRKTHHDKDDSEPQGTFTASGSHSPKTAEEPTTEGLVLEHERGMFCQFCGFKLVGDDSFCRRCGRKI